MEEETLGERDRGTLVNSSKHQPEVSQVSPEIQSLK